jgi:plastocyanin|tara:strand:+ start:421 stop:1095 length:675 start_codon:yes stop_codon:yes gene_type:complete
LQKTSSQKKKKAMSKSAGWILLTLVMMPCFASAIDLKLSIVAPDALAVEDAVVELLPLNADAAVSSSGQKEMSQQDRTFIPFVLTVPKGTRVNFPNLDRTRHHVYSFSEPKPFELKLYVGTPQEPVLFDKPGIVALGCNIHDYMQAFIYVSDSSHARVTDSEGQASFTGLPAGNYRLRVWHPWQNGELLETALTLPAENRLLKYQIDIDRQQKPSAPPAGFGGL